MDITADVNRNRRSNFEQPSSFIAFSSHKPYEHRTVIHKSNEHSFAYIWRFVVNVRLANVSVQRVHQSNENKLDRY